MAETALHLAAKNGQEELVEQLLAQNPEMSFAVTHDGHTALHFAAMAGHDNIVTRLLPHAHMAKVFAKTTEGETALGYASYKGHDKIVTRLLAAYCGTSRFDTAELVKSECKRALILAAAAGRDKVVEELLARSHPLFSTMACALQDAAEYGHDKTMQLLIARDPRVVDLEQWPSLDVSIRGHHERVVELLLAVRPEQAKVVDEQGNTLLHRVVAPTWRAGFFSGRLVAKVWRMKPSAARATNRDGRTPFEVAAENLNWEALELLQWTATLGDIAVLFKRSAGGRTAAVICRQCEPLLNALNRDVLQVVFGYIGLNFSSLKRATATVEDKHNLKRRRKN